ncbi:hypothetical protein [Alteripontixanthobacter muriae]|uniref:hypothetical protein n=1 Tax=Alteripontixanthobacter muriae TaxID=2705546 RepID=UPI001574F9D2|nr:hypothetical protein [Alteripontixanthobacter muriae]
MSGLRLYRGRSQNIYIAAIHRRTDQGRSDAFGYGPIALRKITVEAGGIGLTKNTARLHDQSTGPTLSFSVALTECQLRGRGQVAADLGGVKSNFGMCGWKVLRSCHLHVASRHGRSDRQEPAPAGTAEHCHSRRHVRRPVDGDAVEPAVRSCNQPVQKIA